MPYRLVRKVLVGHLDHKALSFLQLDRSFQEHIEYTHLFRVGRSFYSSDPVDSPDNIVAMGRSGMCPVDKHLLYRYLYTVVQGI